MIGHTRFATSSINIVSELHPHEWIPARNEVIWKYNSSMSRFERSILNTCIHITHNGDFDALEAYSQTMVNEEIGYWLEKILHQSNDLKGNIYYVDIELLSSLIDFFVQLHCDN